MRKEQKANHLGNAEIHFQRALQIEPRNAKIHLELAQLYAEWANKEPAREADRHARRLAALAEAARFGKDPEPRRLLLTEAIVAEDSVGSVQWASKLIELEHDAADAHYALAVDALDAAPADLASAGKHLKVVADREPQRARTWWVQARLAKDGGDEAALKTVMEQLRARPLSAQANAVDRMAAARLRLLDALDTTDPATLSTRLDALRRRAAARRGPGRHPVAAGAGRPAARRSRASPRADRRPPGRRRPRRSMPPARAWPPSPRRAIKRRSSRPARTCWPRTRNTPSTC